MSQTTSQILGLFFHNGHLAHLLTCAPVNATVLSIVLCSLASTSASSRVTLESMPAGFSLAAVEETMAQNKRLMATNSHSDPSSLRLCLLRYHTRPLRDCASPHAHQYRTFCSHSNAEQQTGGSNYHLYLMKWLDFGREA